MLTNYLSQAIDLGQYAQEIRSEDFGYGLLIVGTGLAAISVLLMAHKLICDYSPKEIRKFKEKEERYHSELEEKANEQK